MTLFIDNQKFQDDLFKSFDSYDSCYIAVAWVTSGEHLNALKYNLSKIKCFYTGLYGTNRQKTTSEDFVQRFRTQPNFHFVRNIDSERPLILHSKHYFFVTDEHNWCCYVGSANFTKRGLQEKGNFETMIKVSSSDINCYPFYRDNVDFFNKLDKNYRMLICDEAELNQYCKIEE